MPDGKTILIKRGNTAVDDQISTFSRIKNRFSDTTKMKFALKIVIFYKEFSKP